MKKTFSVLLALIMAISCSLLTMSTAFADDITFSDGEVFESSNEMVSGNTYTIPAGVTVTVPENLTVYVPNSASLKVEQGGTLKLDGEMVVSKGGKLTVDGTLIGAENNLSGSGEMLAQVRFPSLSQVGLKNADGAYLRVWYASSKEGKPYENEANGFTSVGVPEEGSNSIYCPINQYLYIIADIVKDGDVINEKFDDTLMNVYLNRVEVPLKGSAHMTKLLSAGDITYSKWTNDDAFLKTYRIALTSGKGYTVYGRDGEEGTAYVKYGSPFKFRVEIDEDYQMSGTTMEVYIYNGYGVVEYNYNDPNQQTVRPSLPDANGYYTIGSVTKDHTVYVSMLSIDDATVTKVGGILQTVRSIFEMIINFFRQIANAFGIGG